MLIDSHCHLGFSDYPPDELDAILARAADNDVAYLINIGAGEGVAGNDTAFDIAQKYPQVFCTIGLHPHDAKLNSPEVVAKLKNLAKHEKVVAIGEIGLDFHYTHSPPEIQRAVLATYIELALELGKPIMIHDRDAGSETYDILKSYGVKSNQVMIHCFTGDRQLAEKYLEIGCLLSFTGIITFKKAEALRAVVTQTPIEKMLIETDSPFLAPVPYRGKRNEPAYVRYVASEVARLKNLSFEDVARITTLNAKRFFKLPLPELTTSLAYAIRNSLYLNITNQCTLACRFCPKFTDFEVKGYYLKLDHEPTVAEIIQAGGDVSKYDEVVFCGYGEPTRRLEALLEVARHLKKLQPTLKIRLNTDGLGNLIHNKNILPDLATCIDALSVSLNAQDAETYVKHCPNKFKLAAYPAVKEFIKTATRTISDVTATVVGLPDVDEGACKKIAEQELGAKFRFRPYNQVG